MGARAQCHGSHAHVHVAGGRDGVEEHSGDCGRTGQGSNEHRTHKKVQVSGGGESGLASTMFKSKFEFPPLLVISHQSGCVSSCVNLCKAPTQAFFTEEALMPTTLKPDFETFSCDIIFGQVPESRAADTAFTQPCFAVNCAATERTAERGHIKDLPVKQAA